MERVQAEIDKKAGREVKPVADGEFRRRKKSEIATDEERLLMRDSDDEPQKAE